MQSHFNKIIVCDGTVELTDKVKADALVGYKEFCCSKCSVGFKTRNKLEKHYITCNVMPIIQIQNNITNNIQNNNFTVNSYLNTDTSKLTDEDYISALLDSTDTLLESVPRIIKRLHFDPEVPENQNIKAYPKDKMIYIKSHNDEWEPSHKSIIKNIIDDKIKLMNKWAILTEREAQAKTIQKRIEENDKSMDNLHDHEIAIDAFKIFKDDNNKMTEEKKKDRINYVLTYLQRLTTEIERLKL